MGIIYFDGVCGLCNRFVRFVLRHDPEHVFRFAPLQGKKFRRYAEGKEGLNGSDSLVVVWEAGKGGPAVFVRGQAVLEVLQRLRGYWFLATLLRILPLPCLDWLYDLVATNRYRLCGKSASCRKPTGKEQRYFLD
ncbi:thiol-disulfide oxidoreductase DCC family protein [Verrucomicrobium sp. 3C]|uniref:thiol-disulfide oxidoreductase DCC family protein n=1 Tax=Verrucomicrobium sp. 3C TaxID=1134055 RepID=UPI0003700C56|nr:DCC1-like thiol-disulfide oxidoreductase family protein [Verrucomicrobium sp. 3C]